MNHDEIVEEIGRLSETTSQLRTKLEKPKTRMDNFKEYAGIVSLLLSLATGFFALFASFVLEPEKSKAESRTKLHETLAQIVTLDQEYLRELQQGDPNANNGVLQAKRNILLQQAEDIANSSGVASAEDQFNLGNAFEFGWRFEPALNHYYAALRLADKDALMMASADARIGRLNFYGINKSTQTEGRQHFDEAERVLGKPAAMQTGIALVQALTTRAWVECAVGDAALGMQARARAQDEVASLARDPVVSPQTIDAYKVSLVTGFSNTHCADGNSPPKSPAAGEPATTTLPMPLTSNRIDSSNRMMSLLVARNYAAFEANMTSTAQSQLPENQLRSVWEKIADITGAYKQTLSTRTNIVNNVTYYIVHARCEKTLVNVALVFDDANRVSYLLITPLSPLSKSEIEQRAERFVSDFFQQKFEHISSQFDQALKAQMPAEGLQPLFLRVMNAAGPLRQVLKGTKDKDLDIVDVLCEMQAGKASVRVSFDPDMRISAFYIAPAK
jgi:hypothetical protein